MHIYVGRRLGNAVCCAEVLVGVGVGQDGSAAAVLDGGAAEALEGIVGKVDGCACCGGHTL